MKNILIINLVLVLVIGVGWVKNIIKLSECDFAAPYKAEIVHTVGLVPPIGAITGWLDVGK
jgi:hypothetical protein